MDIDDFKAVMYCREEADYDSVYSKDKASGMLEAAHDFNDVMRKLVSE